VTTGTSNRFDRYEKARDELATTPAVSRFERWSSPHTHPGGGVWRGVIVKLRVLAMFIIRRLGQGGGRRQALAGMRNLAGSALGKTVLVVGSGPSAESLKGKAVAARQRSGELVVISTNHFLASTLAKTVTPDFLVWSDDGFHPKRHRDNPERWELVRANPTVTLVMPWTWKKDMATTDITNQVVFFDDDSLETWSKNISPLKPRGYQGTTGAKALALAVHLGSTDIQMIGIDLSYFTNFAVNADNTVTRHPTHVAGTDSGQQDLTDYTLLGMADLLYSTANHFRAFHTHFSGKNISNLDATSLVDAFPKISDSPLTKK
jgi:hypothetical protein